MKPSTAGLLTAMSGFFAIPLHAATAFMTLIGTGLGSTPGDRVPDRAADLWGISLYGTPIAAVALLVLLIRWTKPVVVVYAAIWLALVGCYGAGWVIYGASSPGPLLLPSAVPLASAGIGLYGVWSYRNSEEGSRNTR